MRTIPSKSRIGNRPLGGPRDFAMDTRPPQVAPPSPQLTDDEIQRVMAQLSATDDVEVICANVGKIEKEERDFIWMWLFDLFKVAARGQQVGQINRHVPCVLTKIDARMLRRVKAYRERIFQRANLDESRGMAIGRTNITYGGGGSNIERIVERKFDKRGKNGGYGPDSYAELNEGNFPESVVQNGGGGTGSLEKAQARADAVENMKDQLWEDTLEQALAKNPDGDIDVLRAEFDAEVVVDEAVPDDDVKEVANDEASKLVTTVTFAKTTVDRALDEEPETLTDVELETIVKGETDDEDDEH